ncbi:hypothetical protein N0V82_008031, partial [Gnomoniopsis sp. IMI 355080]
LEIVGLNVNQLKKRKFYSVLGTNGGANEEDWRKRVKKKLNRIRRKLHKGKIREEIEQRRDRKGEEPVANAKDPPSVIVDEDKLARYKGVVIIRNFLGPTNLATGIEEAIRAPRDKTS